MANVQHTDSGTTDPQLAPPSIGAHYINTVSGQTWVAHGTARVEDWGSPLPGHALVATGNELALNHKQPITVWRLTPGQFNPVLVLPDITEPGFYEMLLVLENTSGVQLEINMMGSGNTERMDKILRASVSSATVYRFHCWVPLESVGGSNFWTQAERTYHVEGSDYIPRSDNAWLTIAGADRKFSWSFNNTRSADLILKEVGNSSRMDPIVDVELLILNFTGGVVTITVDTAEGYPLKGVTQIIVQPNTGQRYTLTFCRSRWSVASIQEV